MSKKHSPPPHRSNAGTRGGWRLAQGLFVVINAGVLIALSTRVLRPAGATPGPTTNATDFIATRVVEVLTQNAMTAAAPTALPDSAAAPLDPTLTPEAGTLVLPTSGATVTPRSLPVDSPTPATPCPDQACAAAAEHFWLERPAPSGYVNYADRTYPYGSTQNGAREPHHGIEFANPRGTPVIVAAPGTVIVAGHDAAVAYGPAILFYGNLVVVQLDQTYHGQPVFNLYAHLQNVSVAVGRHVNAGDVLGTVGQTGVAIGPHLHFEVRVGRNDYDATRNPELWLKPLLYNGQPWGVIAGRVVDTSGRLVDGHTVVIRPITVDYDQPRSRFITTYAPDPHFLHGDDALQENFAIGDMPLGTYAVSVNTTTLYSQTVTVTPGHITWVTFVVGPPAPMATPAP